MRTVIDELMQQHGEVLYRIGVASPGFADAQVCAAFIDFLEQDVVSHFAMEEEVLFPELARIPRLVDGPLRIMNAEHDTFRSLLEEARRARHDRRADELSRIATALATLLQAHIAKEDGVLFPLALELLTEEQRDRMDRHETHALPTENTSASKPA